MGKIVYIFPIDFLFSFTIVILKMSKSLSNRLRISFPLKKKSCVLSFSSSVPQVEAGRPSSQASDMYSLGALLFHIHFPDHPTGPLPVGDGTSVLSIPRDADPATVSLLKGLLAAEPEKRPTAADALQVCFSLFLSPLLGVFGSFFFFFSLSQEVLYKNES